MLHTIFHIDMDSFFASIEESILNHPKDKPLIVGGRNKIGVVSSANYIARKLGIKSAMPISHAKKICPNITIANVHHDIYNKISYKIYLFLKSLTEKIEIGSIDEWYLDASESKFESWNEEEFASYIKNSINKEFKLNCTIGCSWNKFLAKMATNLSKPNGFLILTKDNFKEKIYHLDISKMFSVGGSKTKILKENGINKIGDIVSKNINEIFLKKKLGTSWISIKENALGISSNFVNNINKQKSIGRSHTIIEYTDFIEYKKLLINICKDLNKNLFYGKFSFKNITMKIKMQNKETKTLNIKNDIEQKWINDNEIISLFDLNISNYDYKNIQNISVIVWPINEFTNDVKQINLFDNLDQNNIEEIIISKINNKFKSEVLFKANDLRRKYYKPSK